MAACFTQLDAGHLVLDLCPPATDIDDTLEQAGFITDKQRAVFVEKIAATVRAKGCNLNARDIPHDGNTTVRDIRKAVFENATKAHGPADSLQSGRETPPGPAVAGGGSE